jgi:flagellar protein FliO/FliZ
MAGVALSLGMSAGVMGQELKPRAALATQPVAPGKATTASGPDSMNMSRVALSLGAVIAVIFVAKWGASALMGRSAPGRASGAVSVVSRSVVGPRQQLMLVQVGKRLVLVGNSGGQMNSLCEISEAEEVGELLGKLRAERGDSITKTFSSLFRKEEEKFEEQPALRVTAQTDEEENEVTEDDMGATRDELKSLVAKVRGLSKQFRA